MIKHRESTLNRPPSCPKDGVHLLANVPGGDGFLFGNDIGQHGFLTSDAVDAG